MLILHKCRDIINQVTEANLTEGELLAVLNTATCWEHISRVHDWRNYVPKEIRNLWSELGLDAKAMVYALARKQADREEWD